MIDRLLHAVILVCIIAASLMVGLLPFALFEPNPEVIKPVMLFELIGASE